MSSFKTTSRDILPTRNSQEERQETKDFSEKEYRTLPANSRFPGLPAPYDLVKSRAVLLWYRSGLP